MSATPPKRPAARHSMDFLSRMEQARLRRAETLQVRTSQPDNPVTAEAFLLETSESSMPVLWSSLCKIMRIGVAAPTAFLKARLRALAALPLVRRQDVKLLWVLPVICVVGLAVLMTRSTDAPRPPYANNAVNAAVTQLVSARVPETKSQLNVASALPYSAATLGTANIALFGYAEERAPTPQMGPAISFQPPSPHLARLVLPSRAGTLSAEPVAPLPDTVISKTVVRSGDSVDRPIRIFLPDGIDATERQAVVEKITTSIAPHVSARDVAFEVSQSHIRVYAKDDIKAAERMAVELGYLLRDMTAHEPKPPAGLIEIYIAGLPLGAEPIAQQMTVSNERVAPSPQGVAATRAAIDEVLKELSPQPVLERPQSSGHIRPKVVYETQVIETSKPAQKRGLLGRIFKN